MNPDRARPLEGIAGFAALLREHGLKVGIAEQQAMVRSALSIAAHRPAVVEAAWRAIACHDARDWKRWPDLFARYWHPDRTRGSSRISGQTRPSRSLQQLVQSMQQQMGGEGAPATPKQALDASLQAPSMGDTDPGLPRAQGGASRTDPLHDRTFSQWLPQDLALLEQLAERIARRLRRQLTRRWRDLATGRRLDLRRTLRASLRTGGVPMDPVWRAPRREPLRLFVLVDVSRSMETHAQLFLRIARALVTAMDARAFVFHTRLAEVTPLLRSDSAKVQEKVNAVTAGFGGGTRIAASLDDFHRVHARGRLGRRARVWVLSDGFDADETPRLAQELAAIRAHGARITWLHPSAQPPASEAVRHAVAHGGLIDRFTRLDRLSDLADLAGQLQ